jgi:anti-sigma B factor antagonist
VDDADLPQLDAAITTLKAGENAYVVSVAGELDLYSTPQLVAELEALAPDGPELVLDLGAVTFIDSTGLGAILLNLRRLRAAGGDMAIVCANDTARRLLGLVGLDRVIPLFETSSRALEHLVGSVVLRKLQEGRGPS